MLGNEAAAEKSVGPKGELFNLKKYSLVSEDLVNF